MTDLIEFLRAQLDTDERGIETCRRTEEPGDWDFELRQVQAHRAILDEYEHQLAKKAENGRRFVALAKSSSLDQQEFTNVKTHGWELSGRVAALKFAVDTLVSIYSDRDGYREEWRP